LLFPACPGRDDPIFSRSREKPPKRSEKGVKKEGMESMNVELGMRNKKEFWRTGRGGEEVTGRGGDWKMGKDGD